MASDPTDETGNEGGSRVSRRKTAKREPGSRPEPEPET